MSLNEIIKDFLLENGAIKVGFANKDAAHFIQEDKGPEVAELLMAFIRDNPINWKSGKQ